MERTNGITKKPGHDLDSLLFMEKLNGITKKQSRAMVWIFVFLLAFALFLDVGLTLIPVFGWEGVWRSLAIDLVNETPFRDRPKLCVNLP